MAMEERVFQAFKNFDKDDSGSISRDELAEVLLALPSGNPWTNEDIDQLLAQADASGDGELQVQEFLKWIFAENKDISKGLQGKYMLSVSGCSRTQFNGDYIQEEGEFYYRRPVFHCLQNKMYLFYHGKRGQWQIYRRTGTKTSCRLKTPRTAHMPGEGVTWGVWKKSKNGKKTFVEEPKMTCTAKSEMSLDEHLVNAEDCVKFDELYFKKIDKVLGDRAVYQHSKGEGKWGETYLFYEAPQSRWKRGNDAKLGHPSLNVSRITEVASPQLALWMDETNGGKIDVVAVDTDGVPNTMGSGLRFDPSVPDGWKDKDFPHDNSSIGKRLPSLFGEPRWLRARALHPSPVLFADVEPADACQGHVGNCWLIAALSALAEFPSFFKNKIFITKKVSESGKYQIKLYDGRKLRWTIIEIDDYLPCTSWGGMTPQLIFSKIQEGKLCMALLEKAFAKLYGSYSALTAGFQPVAWHHLTGCDEFFRYKSSYEVAVRWVVDTEGLPVYSDKKRSKKLGILAPGSLFHEKQRIGAWIQFKKASGTGPEEGWLSYYSNGRRVAKRNLEDGALRFTELRVKIDPHQVMEAVKGDIGKEGKGSDKVFKYYFNKFLYPEEFWKQIVEYDKGNYLMASSATRCKREVDCGMVHGHAYSLLHAVEVDGVRLIACRNPWGSDSEWNGPWSDRSEEWKANPTIAKALKVDFQTEGTFWMDWEDWQFIMGQVNVMNYQMPSTRGDFYKQLEDGGPDAPEDQDDPEPAIVDTDLIHDHDEDDAPDDSSGGELLGCSGLGTWNAPALLKDGCLMDPGESTTTFQNVPSDIRGKTFFSLKSSTAESGMWTIEYLPPTKIYVWLMKGKTGMLPLDEMLPKRGWDQEPADGFQSSDGKELLLFSKWFSEDEKYYMLHTSDPIVGGVLGTYPLPKAPKPETHRSNSWVTKCSGLGVEWNEPQKMAEGLQTNPGEQETFKNVPELLLNGSYIGSKSCPKAGEWQIEYQAPCKLYVWATANTGMDELNAGWAVEKAEGFQRSDGQGLKLWSKHFAKGSSYCIKLSGDGMAGVVGTQLGVGGKVTKCSGLEIDWNAPQTITEGTLTNPGDRDYVFENVPAILAGGLYIGSRTWPKAGVWTIEYEAPAMLYIWIETYKYDAGVSEFLQKDGWTCEEAENFQRRQEKGVNPLALYSRHFATGTSYSITTNDLMVGGVISECSEV